MIQETEKSTAEVCKDTAIGFLEFQRSSKYTQSGRVGYWKYLFEEITTEDLFNKYVEYLEKEKTT